MDDKGTWYTDDDLNSIFSAALEITSDEERAAYLDRVCAHDPALRAKVEKLLRAQARAGNFMRDDDESDAGAPSGGEGPGTRIGPYRLIQVIGEGGMGTVYMAEQTDPVARRVALKIIKPGMDTGEVAARFEAERQALALMDHPGIAKVFDAGATEAGRPYFVMELVKGIPITEYCDEHGLEPRRRLELFVHVCHAVQHAHQKGIIHRDLKPANILVGDYDDKPVCKVIDFGVAKATGQRLTEKTMYTRYGQIVGTFEYMSPEQAKLDQLDIDTRSDIYSLGVVLYELLTGAKPFEQAKLEALGFEGILRMIREEEPPKPSTRISTLGDRNASVTASRRTDARKLQQALRGELDWIVMRAMDKDRTRRYESASSFAADIQRFLNGEMVHACPPSTAYRVRKFVRRHRGPVVAAATLLLVLVMGLAGTTYGLVKATSAESKAVRLNFRMAMDRGLDLCGDGHVGHGMLWLARALELCPPDETAMQRVVRANLSAWHEELNSLEMIFPHEEPVIGVTFSPDGTLLLTASNDNTAQLWDVRTGRRVGKPLPHSDDAHEVAFSSDGSRLLTSDYYKTAFLWDAATGNLIHTFRHDAPLVPGAAFRPPDDLQLVTGAGPVVTIWDARSGEAVGELKGHGHLVHDVAVSRDGSRILTACHDNNVRLWDFDSRELLVTIQHRSRVPTADFCGEDDGLVVTGDADGNIYLWNVEAALAKADGDVTLSVSAGDFIAGGWRHQGVVHRLRASADGRRVLSGSFDNTARLWDAETGREAGPPFEHQTSVQGVAFSADGTRIATGCDDNAARVWRAAVGQSVRTVEHETPGNQDACYTSDGRYIFTNPDDNTVLLRDVATGGRICEIPYEGAVRAVEVSADGSRVLIGGANQTGVLVDVATREPLFPAFPHASEVFAVDLSRDGSRTVTGDFFGSVQIRDATGNLVQQMKLGARIWSAAFSPDITRVAVGGGDKMVRVFDTGTWNNLHMLAGHKGTVSAIAFSRDGRRIASGGQDNTVHVWDAETGEPLSKPMRLGGTIWYPGTVAFGPDGRTVVTGCDDRTARIWDIATSKPIGPALRHEASVRMVALAGDAEIRTGTARGTVRLWNPTLSPLRGDVERIKLWVEVETGLELDPEGTLTSLDAAAWERRRARLTALGGTPSSDR